MAIPLTTPAAADEPSPARFFTERQRSAHAVGDGSRRKNCRVQPPSAPGMAPWRMVGGSYYGHSGKRVGGAFGQAGATAGSGLAAPNYRKWPASLDQLGTATY
jgi:hypothetical protein